MPMLAPEPNVFPDALFEDNVGAASERGWFVLHTRPRQEKALARHLFENQVPFYLPLITRRNLIRNRVLESHVPLFAGYVFLLAGREERTLALTSNRVVNTLPVADQPRLWHDLTQIYRLIRSGAPVTPEERLEPGDPVEIRHGPLAGLRGVILKEASGRRFVVQVDFIQRGASVLLEDCNLIPLDAAG